MCPTWLVRWKVKAIKVVIKETIDLTIYIYIYIIPLIMDRMEQTSIRSRGGMLNTTNNLSGQSYIILIGISELTGLFESPSAYSTMIVQIKWRGCLDSDWIYLKNSVFWDTTPYTVVVICQGLLYHPHPRDLQLDAAGTSKRLCTSNRLQRFLYNKTNRGTNFPNLFCQETLHVLGSSSAHHQEFSTVY